ESRPQPKIGCPTRCNVSQPARTCEVPPMSTQGVTPKKSPGPVSTVQLTRGMSDGNPLDRTAVNFPGASRKERLALLYQGMFTAIVRIQSGRQPLVDADAFQKRMEGLLAEIERETIRMGYRNPEIDDAKYAVVAFLDEAIQRSDDP